MGVRSIGIGAALLALACNDEPVSDATLPGSAVFDIAAILGGAASLSDAITSSVEQSICDPYDPIG